MRLPGSWNIIQVHRKLGKWNGTCGIRVLGPSLPLIVCHNDADVVRDAALWVLRNLQQHACASEHQPARFENLMALGGTRAPVMLVRTCFGLSNVPASELAMSTR